MAVALSTVFAWLTYKIVEKPIRSDRSRGGKVAALAAAMSCVAAVGLALFESGDLPSHMPAYVTSASNAGPWWHDVKVNCEGVMSPITENDFCIVSLIQDPKSPIDLVLGDSHAFAFASGLALPGGIGAKNLYVVSRAGCPPFISVDRYEDGQRRSCDFEEIINRLSAGRGIKNLILIGRYAFYASGDGYGSDGGLKPGNVSIVRHSMRPDLGEDDYASVLADGLKTTLLTVKAARITVVLEAPELGFDPKSCVDVRPVRLTTHVRTPCAITRREVDLRQQNYKAPFLDVLKGFPTVRVIDPMDTLCDAALCYGIDGNEVRDTDSNHVNALGASKVLKALAEGK
jgi:hypothetical protein